MEFNHWVALAGDWKSGMCPTGSPLVSPSVPGPLFLYCASQPFQGVPSNSAGLWHSLEFTFCSPVQATGVTEVIWPLLSPVCGCFLVSHWFCVTCLCPCLSPSIEHTLCAPWEVHGCPARTCTDNQLCCYFFLPFYSCIFLMSFLFLQGNESFVHCLRWGYNEGESRKDLWNLFAFLSKGLNPL